MRRSACAAGRRLPWSVKARRLQHLDAMTLWRYAGGMDDSKRATVYFDPAVHKALRLKAAATERSISEMVNAAVKVALAEDAEDFAAVAKRKSERSMSFESVVRDLRQRGRI